MNEDLFVVGEGLSEDGRVGKITDLQGMVAIKPVMAERWTPVCGHIVLKPGDWLRTDARGANAVAARLVGQTQIVAGPGTLVEMATPRSIRLYEGEIKIGIRDWGLGIRGAAAGKGAAEKGAGTFSRNGPSGASQKRSLTPFPPNPQSLIPNPSPLELLGPGNQKLSVAASGVYRVEKERLVRVEQEPKWLKGFEGTEVQESIGSLLANIDGRNVPLTVGYHRVTVDIRDQIARTTVEESFVNHTDGRLEGVFYFPLPQDASISGFGMWIGDELVEADIVEKQRAREIYEEILRERRDPGLLEWSGGNMFKARVFPIEAHAEKRIRIIYTQVLPLVHNAFRYSYALESEMLRQHPLRELSIDVKINSALPLKKVASPTHTVRTDCTAHSAHVEFAAQQYTPTRDFEVVAELEGQQTELTLIPHRRGDDGYFMLLVTPPAAEAPSDRDLLMDKEPLDLIVLADTSASLDSAQRGRQGEFVAALLESLYAARHVQPGLLRCRLRLGLRQGCARRRCATWQPPGSFSTAAHRWAGPTWPRPSGRPSSARPHDAHRLHRRRHPDRRRRRSGGAGRAAARLYEEKCRDTQPVCHAVAVGSTFRIGRVEGHRRRSTAVPCANHRRARPRRRGPRTAQGNHPAGDRRPQAAICRAAGGAGLSRALPNLPGGSQQVIAGPLFARGGRPVGRA